MRTSQLIAQFIFLLTPALLLSGYYLDNRVFFETGVLFLFMVADILIAWFIAYFCWYLPKQYKDKKKAQKARESRKRWKEEVRDKNLPQQLCKCDYHSCYCDGFEYDPSGEYPY